jgi:D-glycerate 3-kinase
MSDQEQPAEGRRDINRELSALQQSLALDDRAFASLTDTGERLADWIAARAIARRAERPGEAYVLGITGAQGSGKTTLSRLLSLLLGARGLSAAQLSLDDLYLTHAERRRLRDQCRWFRFRGPFGTHDLELGLEVIKRLKHCRGGDLVRVPVFDKSLHNGEGDRLPAERWRAVSGPVDVVLFEGWCLGARPLSDAELAKPVNDIETLPEYDDAPGTFRRRLNDELRRYQPLFGLLDDLAVLHVGSVENIYRWRMKQEQGLKRQAGTGMDPATLRSFVDYFLPTTERYILPLGEQPAGRASAVLTLGDNHQATELRFIDSENPSKPVQ